MTDMVEVIVDSVKVSLMSPEALILLREKGKERFLPMFIEQALADGISTGLHDLVTSQPSSWNLIINSLTSLNVKVFRVEIIKLQDNTYYGNIVAGTEGDLKNIDSRSSDAIAIAVRAHVPIFVSSDIMDVAGIVREADIRIQPSQAAESPPESKQEVDDKHLSVYKDFLKDLDWGDGDNKNKNDDKD